MKLVLGSRNPGKLVELKELFNIEGLELVPITDFNVPDVEETGSTFASNAVLKARYAAVKTGIPAIADDSGMEIYVLNDFPGIYSARCAGEDATDEEKKNFILEKMKGIQDRKARFVCVMAYCEPDNNIPTYFTGTVEGEILTFALGKSKPNLQYDSIFYYEPAKQSFAMMPEDEKNKVSHRSRASKSMRKFLEEKIKSKFRREYSIINEEG